MSEAAQLKKIEELGLVREIIHIRWWRPWEDKNGRSIDVPHPQILHCARHRLVTGMTVCKLYTKADHALLVKFFKMHKDAPRSDAPVKPVAKGDARCSHLDNFCKRTGRIVATARALQQVLGTA